jgi:hypothetical protein
MPACRREPRQRHKTLLRLFFRKKGFLLSAPLILTLMLDDASQALFDRARARWFPPAINLIGAHVTMFHHLPGAQLVRIEGHVRRVCESQIPVRVSVTGLRSLGRGVAYTLRAVASCSALAGGSHAAGPARLAAACDGAEQGLSCGRCRPSGTALAGFQSFQRDRDRIGAMALLRRPLGERGAYTFRGRHAANVAE